MMIEIPCNVGDKLFIVSEYYNILGNEEPMLYVEENYCYGIEYHNDIYTDRFVIYIEHQTEDWGDELAVYFDEDIGTRVFFSEKEAEEQVEKLLKEPMYAEYRRADTVRDLHLKDIFKL